MDSATGKNHRITERGDHDPAIWASLPMTCAEGGESQVGLAANHRQAQFLILNCAGATANLYYATGLAGHSASCLIPRQAQTV